MKIKTLYRSIFLILPIFTLIIAFVPLRMRNVPEVQASEIIDRIVAVVNGEIITLSELEKASGSFYRILKNRSLKTGEKMPSPFQLRKRVLDALIDKKLTEQEAKKLKITVSSQDVDSAINRLLNNKGITRLQLLDGLKKDGKTLSDLREDIRDNIQRARLLNQEIKSKIVITDDQIADFYQKHIGEFTKKDKWHLRVIMLPYSDQQDPGETMKLARKIKADLDKGASFADLAEKYSQGPAASEGGDLGYLSPTDLDPTLGNFVSALPVGGVSPIINTDTGIYIFMVQDIKRGQSKSLEQVKNYIKELLYQKEINKRYNKWLKDLRARSYIKINL